MKPRNQVTHNPKGYLHFLYLTLNPRHILVRLTWGIGLNKSSRGTTTTK